MGERAIVEDEMAERERIERIKQEAQHAELEARLNEEEQMRLRVLEQLDRSQMPAVQSEDGRVVKTIEHYTFADANDTAPFSIDFDKDVFEGAASFVSTENVEVTTRESDVTIVL